MGNYNQFEGVNTISLYKWNTLLSESLYPTLQTIEVLFRNAICHGIETTFGNKEWLLGNDLLTQSEQRRVNETRNYIIKNNKEPTSDRLVAELSFGFWTSLLDARYEHHLWRYIIKIVFPKMPRSIRVRKNISRRFEIIRKLRNRIFHYEPIWHLKDLKNQHYQILEAIQWIDGRALKLIEKLDRFEQIYESGPWNV